MENLKVKLIGILNGTEYFYKISGTYQKLYKKVE